MANDRDDRRYGRDQGGYRPQQHRDDDRGFFNRAGDEVRSWFGDDEAERRRRYDEQNGQRDHDRQGGDRDRGGYDRGSSSYRGSGGMYDRSSDPRSTYSPEGAGYDRGESSGFGGRYSGPDTGGGSGFGGGGFGGQGRSDFGGGRSTSDYGAGRGAGATSAWGLGAGHDREEWGHDPNYRSWRDRQMESLDRDYDEYRREHQSKFENEFATWRTGRQGQREMLNKVQEHQEVLGSDGSHVGTVDHVRGDRILLTKSDKDAGGHHHSIPSLWIDSVDDKVKLRKTADEAKAAWRDEERNMSGQSDQDKGAHNLNRSFSGTY